MKLYCDNYTWSHPMGDSIIAYTDGAASFMFVWSGVDVELLTDQQKQNIWLDFYRLLHHIDINIVTEFHLWREHDRSMADEYILRSNDISRGGDFAYAIRNAQAEHLAAMGRTNSVAVVLTLLPKSKTKLGVKRALKNQTKLANQLLKDAPKIMKFLPGAKALTINNYLTKIQQSYYRDAFLRDAVINHDHTLRIAEQCIHTKPILDNGMLKIGDTYTKVLFAFLYPEFADPGWLLALSSINCDMHISHIIKPLNTKAAMRQSERSTERAESTMTNRGVDDTVKNINSHRAFRKFVSDNSLQIFKNAMIIHIHNKDYRYVQEVSEAINEVFEKAGGQCRGEEHFQLPYFRGGQPGQGYRLPVFRHQDDTWQVANQLPVHVFCRGESKPDSIYICNNSQIIGTSLSNKMIPHGFTVAMTGAGKGVKQVTLIAETYPLGLDWYILEVGGSYKWVVEALGGNYSHIDDSTAINPFPRFDMATRIPGQKPLPTGLVTNTINALAFILTDGRTALNVAETSAAQMALQFLYAAPADKVAPTLPDYFEEMRSATYYENDAQGDAAKAMSVNLHNFLISDEGSLFTREDNLELTRGITGVDLKSVIKISEKLAKFYLVFISLRFSQMAFYDSRSPANVLLDEIHEMVRIAPDVIGPLCSALSRMGRKDHAGLHLVTQGLTEIDKIEKEVINSMPIRSLLYRGDEWDEISKRINMQPGPLARWKNYPFFEGLDYRPCMLSVGEKYYDLYLTYPQLLLDLAATNPDDLDLKDRIGKKIQDPLERLAYFRQETEKSHAA